MASFFMVVIIPLFTVIGFIIYDTAGSSKVCDDKILTVTEVGGCHSDRYGNGSCGVILNDGTYARLTAPVKGEKIVRYHYYDRNGKEYNTNYEKR